MVSSLEYIAFEHNTAAAELVRSAYDTPPLAFVHSYGCQQNVNDGPYMMGSQARNSLSRRMGIFSTMTGR